MSEMSRSARRAMRAKIHRLTSQKNGKVDASDYGPEETDMNAEAKTGLRPVSRRAYKKGGKVVAVSGKDATKHAGKKPRKGGDLHGLADVLVNRDVKIANEARPGPKHVGGMKTGGFVKKAFGGAMSGGGNGKSQLGQMGGMGNNTPLSGKDFKRGGTVKKADGGEVPTQLLNFAPAQSRMSKAAGLKRGGKAASGWSEEAKAAAQHKTRNTYGSGVPQEGYSPAQGIASKLQNMTERERSFAQSQPKGQWEEMMQRLPRSGGRSKAHDLYGGRKITSEKEYKRGGAAKPFEGTAKDEREDKAEAKKRGMSMKQWEKSPEDKLHDAGCSCERCSGGRVARKSGGGNWIAGAIKHPGALHKELHVPEGEKIPAKKLASAEHSENKTLARRARLAKTLSRMHKATGGSIADMECNQGGRVARKAGGKTGKTDVNIIISAGPRGQQAPPGAPPLPAPGGVPIPVGGPGGPPPAAMPPAAAPAMPPAMPPPGLGAAPPMPRRSGGRAMHHAGAGSGLGRLEKTAIAKRMD